MFNYVAQKINEILGSEYIVLNQFNPQSSKSKEMLNNYNVAVLNLETGTVRPLKGLQGLQADCTLSIIEKIQDTDINSNRIEKALNDLINASNGQLYVQSTETDPSYDNVFDYVINYGVPKFREKVPIDGYDYAIMDISFSITLSADALFGNSGVVSVWNETEEEYEEIEGIIRWSQGIEVQMQTSGELQDTTVTNRPLFDIYSFEISGFLLKDASVTKSLINGFSLTPKLKYKIKLLISDDITFEKYYYISKLNIVGVKSQFIEIFIQFSEAA